jgi:hypothetical protein
VKPGGGFRLALRLERGGLVPVELSKEQYEIVKKMDSGYKLHLVGHLMWRLSRGLSRGGKKEPVDSKSVEDLLRTDVLERAPTSDADPMEFKLKGNLGDYFVQPSPKREPPTSGKGSSR